MIRAELDKIAEWAIKEGTSIGAIRNNILGTVRLYLIEHHPNENVTPDFVKSREVCVTLGNHRIIFENNFFIKFYMKNKWCAQRWDIFGADYGGYGISLNEKIVDFVLKYFIIIGIQSSKGDRYVSAKELETVRNKKWIDHERHRLKAYVVPLEMTHDAWYSLKEKQKQEITRFF